MRSGNWGRFTRPIAGVAALSLAIAFAPSASAEPDVTAPVGNAAVTSPSGACSLGWCPGSVTIDLTATDDVAVQDITWESTGALVAGPTTVPGDSVSIPVTTAGKSVIVFYATDTSSNVSETHYLQVGVDPSNRPVVSVSSETTVLEPDDGTTRGAYFQFNLSKPAATNITVQYYTEDIVGTADCISSTNPTPGCDYLRFGTFSSPRTLTIPAGQRFSQIAVPVLTDSAVEGDEYFALVIKGVGSNAVVGQEQGTALIVDVDTVSLGGNPVLMITPKQSAVESNTGEVRAQAFLSLSKAVGGPITVPTVTGDLSATGNPFCDTAPGTDYRSRNQSYTIAAGAKTQTVDINICPDTADEGDEDLQITYTPDGGAPAGVIQITSPAVIEIIDDDGVQDTTF